MSKERVRFVDRCPGWRGGFASVENIDGIAAFAVYSPRRRPPGVLISHYFAPSKPEKSLKMGLFRLIRLFRIPRPSARSARP